MIRNLFDWTVNRLIARAMRTPYFHLHHGDGSLYMERYWLVPLTYGAFGCYTAKWWREPSAWLLQTLGIAVRVHHICTADLDRSLHDHPWDWVSIVLRGWYLEARPSHIAPCFHGEEEELTHITARHAGSFAFRHATDRHRITHVEPETWTLFITGPKVQWWGFYTPAGKVYYRDYESVHNKAPLPETEQPIPEFLRRTA